MSAGQQSVSLLLAYGSLTLRRLRLRSAGTLRAAHLSVDGRNLPAHFSTEGADVSADLGDGLRLTAGETLVVTLALEPAALGQTYALTP